MLKYATPDSPEKKERKEKNITIYVSFIYCESSFDLYSIHILPNVKL